MKQVDFDILNAPQDESYQLEAMALLVEMAENSDSIIEGGHSKFVEKVYKVLWVNPDEELLDLPRALEGIRVTDRKKPSLIRLNLLRESTLFWVAAAWAVHALRPERDQDYGRECNYVAQRVYGMYLGVQVSRFEALPTMKRTMLGAATRHKDHRADRAHVLAWCDRHMAEYKSMDKAAAAVYEGKEVGVELKTIRGWMTQWKREQRQDR